MAGKYRLYPLDVWRSKITLEILRLLAQEGQLYPSKLGKMLGKTSAIAGRQLIVLEKAGFVRVRAIEGLNKYYELDEEKITDKLVEKLWELCERAKVERKEFNRIFSVPEIRRFVYLYFGIFIEDENALEINRDLTQLFGFFQSSIYDISGALPEPKAPIISEGLKRFNKLYLDALAKGVKRSSVLAIVGERAEREVKAAKK